MTSRISTCSSLVVAPQPREVVRARGRPGHQQVPVLLQPRDGQIALDAAARVQHLRVDDRSGLARHVVRCHPLEEAGRVRAGDLDLREARLVEQRRAFAGGEVLGHDRRRPVFSRPSERPPVLVVGVLVRREPVRALPARLLAEHGAERPQARVRRRHLQGPAGRALLARIVDVVVRRVDLVGACGRVPARPVLRAEPADVHLPEVPGRLAVHDPVGQHHADAAGAGDPVRAEPRRHEEAVHLGRPQEELAVGRERLGPVDHPGDAGVAERRHQGLRVLGDRREPVPVFGQEAVVEVGGGAVLHHPRGGVAFVAAHDEPAARLRSEVDEAVGIAHRRHIGPDAGDRLGQHVLVLERHDRDLDARQVPDLRGVDAAGVHDDVRVDRTVVLGRDAADAAVFDGDAGHARVRPDLRAAPARPLGQRHGEVARIDLAVGGEPRRAQDPGRVEQRPALERLLHGDDLQRQAERLAPSFEALQFLQPFGRGRQPQRSHLAPRRIDAGLRGEPPVQVRRVHHHPGQRHARAELPDETRRVERRAARQLVALQEQHVRVVALHEVVGDRRAGDAAADHDDAGRSHPISCPASARASSIASTSAFARSLVKCRSA